MCAECTEAHRNTRLTKSHTLNPVPDPVINHPLKEEVEEDKKGEERYLISVYRCPTKVAEAEETVQVPAPLGRSQRRMILQ